MPPQKILVTGATGTQGGGVAKHALRAGHDVYALVRNPDSDAAKALADAGAKLIKGSFDDLESLKQATQNTDALYLQPPGNIAKDVEYVKNAIAAAKAASVQTIITSTAVRTGDHETFPGWGPDYPMYRYWLVKQEIENIVRGAGFRHWAIVRPSHFLQNFKMPKSQFIYPGFPESQVLKTTVKPDAKLGWVDASDVGIVAVAVLADPAKYSGREFELAVESLTMGEIAEKISKAIGKPVTAKPYSQEELEAMKGSPVLGSQKWANEVRTDSGAETTAKEFALTSVQEFFKKVPLF